MANSQFIVWGTGQIIVGPLTIQGNVIPSVDNTYDLGTSSLRWRTGYVDTSLIQGGALGLGTTATDGVVLQNTTASTVGTTVQISPRVHFTGTAYNSVSTLSESQDWTLNVLPQTFAGTTWSALKVNSSQAGSAYVTASQFLPLSYNGTVGFSAAAYSQINESVVLGNGGFYYFNNGRAGMTAIASGQIKMGNINGGYTITTGGVIDLATNTFFKFLALDGTTDSATIQANKAKITGLGAFATGDKYVIADASGNLHISALGPAS